MITGSTTLEFTKAISKTCRTSTKLIVTTLALLVLGTTILALTQRESVPVTRVHLCVKDNGQLRMTDNTTPCDPSEQRREWVVGGQVTEIRPGQGLVSNREDGIVNLALDPSILQSCAGCGRIFAGFNDGPGGIPNFVFGEELPQIAKLDLPAGNYAIFAKLVVTAKEVQDLSVTRKELVLCQLSAGNDFDRSSALLEVHDERPILAFTNDEVVLTLQVVHRFAEPGEAVLRCSKGPFAGEALMEYKNLKLIATEASSISNVFLGGN
jgi:hypothetical protein